METKLNEWETTTRKNVRHVAYWTGGWVLTVASATFGPKFLWDYNRGISIIAILFSTIIGVGMFLMNRKYTNGLDEMQRKVTMDATAIACGVGVIGGVTYSMLDVANVIPFDAETGPLIALMGITYFIAFIVGSIRYK
jgi:hypothetical protein